MPTMADFDNRFATFDRMIAARKTWWNALDYSLSYSETADQRNEKLMAEATALENFRKAKAEYRDHS